jgi:alpha-tubulin suppressor-like RCC1 family protein
VIAIEKYRVAYAWGNNTYGELGVGERVPNKRSPTVIKSVSGMTLIDCKASKDYSMLLTAQGEVFSFGSNENGKLGHKENDPKYNIHVPKQIEMLKHVVKIATGPHHAMAICQKSIDTNNNIFFKLTAEYENVSADQHLNDQTVIHSWGNGFFG